MQVASPLPEAALATADRVRGAVIRATGPLGRTLAAHRDLRVAALGLGSVGSAIVLSVVAPVWMAILGPATLGVAHLVADVRYLVLRPGLHREPSFWPFVAVPAGLALVVAHPAVGLLAVAGGAALAGGPAARRWTVGALGIGLVLWALGDRQAAAVLAQVHNPFAVALWWAWRPGRRPVHALPVGAYVAGSVAILGGAVDGPLEASLAWAPSGAWQAISWLGAGLPEPWTLRLVAWASFGQMVHYSMWLRCIPEDDRGRESARSLRRQLRELVADVGWPGLGVAAALTVGLLLLVPISPVHAREAYFLLAPFHPYLEFGVAALWACGGVRMASGGNLR